MGRANKWAEKWAKDGTNVWHEKWGEEYDGEGGCVKFTDKVHTVIHVSPFNPLPKTSVSWYLHKTLCDRQHYASFRVTKSMECMIEGCNIERDGSNVLLGMSLWRCQFFS